MELKRGKRIFILTFCKVLIVPSGIETFVALGRIEEQIVLIVPSGIET